MDLRRFRGSLDSIDSWFFRNEVHGDSYWDSDKCRYVVVNEEQSVVLPKFIDNDYLTVVNPERTDTDNIGLIDMDERFQCIQGNLVYSPHRKRVISTKNYNYYVLPNNEGVTGYKNGKGGRIHIGTEVICDYAFAKWTDLEEIYVPNTIKKIGEGAFMGCTNLKRIVIPEGVEIIEENTFADCHWLEDVSLPSTLKEIKPYAFENCYSLINIIIPNSVHTCPREAFKGCLIEKSSGPFPYDTHTRDGHITYPEFGERTNVPKNVSMFSKNNSLLHEDSYYLFFDTETTGLPLDNNAPSSDVDNWPRLVQLGWIITNPQGDVLSSVNRLIIPIDFEIDENATRIHHISQTKAREYGDPLIDVLEEFIIDLRSVAFVVGHNVDFDKKIVGAELIRCGMPDILNNYPSIDTMKMGLDFTDYTDFHGRKKFPKLSELHAALFGVAHRNSHDAMGDVEATVKCFFWMKNQKYYNSKSRYIGKGFLSQNPALIQNIVSARVRKNGYIYIALFLRNGKPIILLLDETDNHYLNVGDKIDPSSIEVVDCIYDNGEKKYVARYSSKK